MFYILLILLGSPVTLVFLYTHIPTHYCYADVVVAIAVAAVATVVAAFVVATVATTVVVHLVHLLY